MSTHGVVYFKFKHQNSFDKIEFGASEISVSELKLKINEKLMLTDHQSSYKNATAIQLSRFGTTGEAGTVYDSDFELIPSHTSVLVMRVPAGKLAGKKIVVESGQLFATAAEGLPDPLALRPSIIQEEIDAKRRVPPVTVCEVCRSFMLNETGHGPVILTCCGNTVCSACASQSSPVCPIEKIDRSNRYRFVPNRALERLIEVVSKHRALFVFDSVVVPEGFLADTCGASDGHGPVAVAEVVDVDEFEAEVFDVDNPRPLTEREKDQLERRERRKRKAAEILMKKEGRVVKGELTEADINKLLKAEDIKAEMDGMDVFGGRTGGVGGHEVGNRMVVIEFPKLLTPEQFSMWQRQQ